MPTRSIKGHMDIRCIDPPWYDDLLEAITETIEDKREVFAEATHQVERFEKADKKGKAKLNGDDVEVNLGLYRTIVNEIPFTIQNLEQTYKVVLKAPTCTDLEFLDKTMKGIKFDARGRKHFPAGFAIKKPPKSARS